MLCEVGMLASSFLPCDDVCDVVSEPPLMPYTLIPCFTVVHFSPIPIHPIMPPCGSLPVSSYLPISSHSFIHWRHMSDHWNIYIYFLILLFYHKFSEKTHYCFYGKQYFCVLVNSISWVEECECCRQCIFYNFFINSNDLELDWSSVFPSLVWCLDSFKFEQTQISVWWPE